MVSLIIVTYNSNLFVDEFLKSLEPLLDEDIETIIIDNNSEDETTARIDKFTKKSGKTKFVKNNKNKGFAAAVNQGVVQSSSSDILLINPDTSFKKDSIQKLISFYNQRKPCIVGGKIDSRGAVSSLSYINSLLELTNLAKIVPGNFWIKNSNKTQEVSVVSGGYMIFSREIFNKVGGFNEDYFLYLEDVDFCIKARRAGYKVYYYPDSGIKHFGGGSSRSSRGKINAKAWFNSRDIFFKTNFSGLEYLIYFAISRIELLILCLTGRL